LTKTEARADDSEGIVEAVDNEHGPSSLDSVIQVIVDDLVEGCVTEVKNRKAGLGNLEELQKVVAAIT